MIEKIPINRVGPPDCITTVEAKINELVDAMNNLSPGDVTIDAHTVTCPHARIYAITTGGRYCRKCGQIVG